MLLFLLRGLAIHFRGRRILRGGLLAAVTLCLLLLFLTYSRGGYPATLLTLGLCQLLSLRPISSAPKLRDPFPDTSMPLVLGGMLLLLFLVPAGGSRRGKSPGKDGRLPGSLHPQPPMALAGRGHPHVKVSLERLSSGRRKSGSPLLHLLPAPGSSLRLHLLPQQHPGHRPKGDALALERLPPRLHPPAPRPSCMAQVPRLPLPACRRRLVLLPCGQPIHQLLPPPPRPTPPHGHRPAPPLQTPLALPYTPSPSPKRNLAPSAPPPSPGHRLLPRPPHHRTPLPPVPSPPLEGTHPGSPPHREWNPPPPKAPQGTPPLLLFPHRRPPAHGTPPLAHQGYAIQHLQIPGDTECLPLLQETINQFLHDEEAPLPRLLAASGENVANAVLAALRECPNTRRLEAIILVHPIPNHPFPLLAFRPLPPDAPPCHVILPPREPCHPARACSSTPGTPLLPAPFPRGSGKPGEIVPLPPRPRGALCGFPREKGKGRHALH